MLIPFFALFFGFDHLRRQKAIRRIGSPALVRDLFKNHSSAKRNFKFTLVLLAFGLGCLALANPRKPEEGVFQLRKGIDIMIALDVSNSMLASDLNPNRLQQAKELINELVAQSVNDRIGLVLFAGSAYVQMPLTFDHDAALLFASSASPASIRAQGTAIGEALSKCDLSFDQESERFKSIVLISDGETHDENALKISKNLAAKGIMVNTVGLGSAEGATITDTATLNPKKDLSGNIVISRLNEELLQQIASVTNGAYIHLTDVPQAVTSLTAQFSQIEKKALGDTSQFIYKTYYIWLALPMLLLLVAEIFISEQKKAAP